MLSFDNQRFNLEIKVSGLVQGVGFRPFIYRIAHEFGIKGWVENNLEGVLIQAEGANRDLQKFLGSIKESAPKASVIESIETKIIPPNQSEVFEIRKSSSILEGITEISPDIAVCADCLVDLKTQPHRLGYPLINCTNCGPRFTIIKELPYDRHLTTMKEFAMCPVCKSEYENILDRRFHAQPVACNDCGPEYRLHGQNIEIKYFPDILLQTAGLVDSGKIIAIKGLGGYHLMCDACNEEAVSNIRSRKLRESKPFAVMFRNFSSINAVAEISEDEAKTIDSWRRPITLVQLKNLKDNGKMARSVTNGFDRIGVMLPYMPIHYQLFEKLKTDAIVLTSGNFSDEPVCITEKEVKEKLSKVADATLWYNREIRNRADDSVVFVANKQVRMIRRSKGYVPASIKTGLNIDGIFAAGAELTNCFAFGKQDRAILSQHIGDLKNMETLEFYEESIERFSKLFRIKPVLAACDLHPDYLSTRFAIETGLPVVRIQHHHAHIAAVMAEHNLDEKVIGVALDGVGLGTDGTIWGSEFFVCDLNDFERYTHFEYIPAPGGDLVTHEPWRMAVAYLHHYFGKEMVLDHAGLFKSYADKGRISDIIEMVSKEINSPLTCSTGRLFDAVSALIQICGISGFHSEAPMRLEAAINKSETSAYSYSLTETISFRTTFKEILTDMESHKSAGEIAAKFHNMVINLVAEVCIQIRHDKGLNKVALSGGTFQNKYLLENIENRLKSQGFNVYSPLLVPSNDAGIAPGQLAIASKKRKSLCV